MKNNIIDQKILGNKEIMDVLTRKGINRIFEKSGKIVVQTNDYIQVSVQLEAGQIFIKPKFPQIGNPVQIIATIVLLASCYFLGFSSIWIWMVAILCGQAIAFGWYYPKIKELKENVKIALS